MKSAVEKNMSPNSLKKTLLNETFVDITFTVPDLEKLKQERQKRNESLFQRIDFVYDSTKLDAEEKSAVTIQKVFRGYMGRKKFIEQLYAVVFAEEQRLKEKQNLQVDEGEILVENYRIERDLEDDDQISRNKVRLLNAKATCIQRAWRDYSKSCKKEHICCSCNDDFPDLFDYYNETQLICFCCEEHRLNPEQNQLYINTNGSTFPSPTTDWLTIDSVLLKERSASKGSLNDEMEQLISRLNVDPGVKLTFVESYESDKNKPDVQIYNLDDTSDSYDVTDMGIEKVTDCARNQRQDALGLVEESTRVLKSLKIHEEHDKKRKMENSYNVTINLDFLKSKSIKDLYDLIDKLNAEVSAKNIELVQELLTRDELHTHHEALLMDADDLAKRCK